MTWVTFGFLVFALMREDTIGTNAQAGEQSVEALPQSEVQDTPELPIRLIGVMSVAGVWVFTLQHETEESTSEWLRLGFEWHGASLISYDQESQLLIARVNRSGREMLLRLEAGRKADVVTPVQPIKFLRGGFSIIDDAMVFSEDAMVTLGDGVVFYAIDGVMIADKEQQVIVGNIAADLPDGMKLLAEDGVVDVRAKSITAPKFKLGPSNK